MYNHMSTLHFLKYICHHSCMEKIHKDLWTKYVWQHCNTAFQIFTMWEEYKNTPTFLIYFFLAEYALKSFRTWTRKVFKIHCRTTCSSIEAFYVLTWIPFIFTIQTKVLGCTITFPLSIFWVTFATILAGRRFTRICEWKMCVNIVTQHFNQLQCERNSNMHLPFLFTSSWQSTPWNPLEHAHL